jgi:hypothetical protein
VVPFWQRRRIQRLRWDIGARDADEALQLLADVDQEGAVWAVGGLAGAATLNRAVEPASVALWVRPEAVEPLATAVRPVQSRGGRGTVEVALGQSRPVKRLPIADPEVGAMAPDRLGRERCRASAEITAATAQPPASSCTRRPRVNASE